LRIARVATDHGAVFAIEQGENWAVIDDPFSPNPTPTGEVVAREGATLLSPVVPRVVLGMAHNGAPENRAQEPQAFQKSARTIAGPGDQISVDPELGVTLIEGELGIVIGRTARRLTLENALDAVLGYTPANDIGFPGQNQLDSFWTQTKNGDNFSPIGPWIDTDFDPSDATIRLSVNGEQLAEASTAQLARNVAEILVYITRYVTLDAGDVVMAGCPGTAAPVEPGDTFTVELVGLGTLENSAR
jgi:2-keto-4-pentenoate hydratase/2-oxohepta-3-ene-1,7-dioic acid hydratase in catechol pathway